MKGVLAGRLQLGLSYAFLLTLLLMVLFPFYWMLITSFKTEDQMRSLVSMFWPSPFVLENYTQLLRKTEFVGWFGNSVIVAVSSTFVATAIGMATRSQLIGGLLFAGALSLGIGPKKAVSA